MQYRKSFDAKVSESDVARIRAFIQNELTYYNILLGAFSSRLRTMPELFNELTPEVLKKAVTQGVDRRDRSIQERVMLFLEEIAVGNGTLLPSVRENMACEMLETYRNLGDALKKQTRAVELLSPMEARTKRNLQVPRANVKIEGNRLSIPYAKGDITFQGQLPDKWDVLALRDPSGTGDWKVEFHVRPEGYDVRLTDPPIRSFKASRGTKPNKHGAGGVWRASRNTVRPR
jgi:hypothetical protein